MIDFISGTQQFSARFSESELLLPLLSEKLSFKDVSGAWKVPPSGPLLSSVKGEGKHLLLVLYVTKQEVTLILLKRLRAAAVAYLQFKF